MTRWDAPAYDRVAGPLLRMGLPVLDRLELVGHERVLDAGCGSGRVTERLAERLEHGTVLAVDASAQMLAEAGRRLARFGDRVIFVHADLGAPPLPPAIGRVDAVLSTAAFHWVRDHDRLFAGLAAVLVPGGRLTAQCGGEGNCASVFRAMADLGLDGAARLTFAGPEETRRRLERVGFEGVRTWLQPEQVAFASATELDDYLVTVFLRPLSDATDDTLPGLAAEVRARLPGLEVDYLRLNIMARRASD